MSINCHHAQCKYCYECKAQPGVRVELHPATDAWMQGDRFGTVTCELPGDTVRVKLDISQRSVTCNREDIGKIIE